MLLTLLFDVLAINLAVFLLIILIRLFKRCRKKRLTPSVDIISTLIILGEVIYIATSD